VKTEIIENIPIVIPKSERKVLNLLTVTELTANRIPSLSSLIKIYLLFLAMFNLKVQI
jgi:hypothetical protein